jgi:hypothetical protein
MIRSPFILYLPYTLNHRLGFIQLSQFANHGFSSIEQVEPYTDTVDFLPYPLGYGALELFHEQKDPA